MRTCSLPRGPPGPRPPDPGTDTRCHDHALTDLGTGTQAQRRRLGRQSHSLTGTVSRPPRQSHPECHIQPPPPHPLRRLFGFSGQLPDFGSWPGFKEPPFSAPAPARVGRCARPQSHRQESPTHSPHSPGIPSVEGEPRYTCRLCRGPHRYPLCPPTSRP